MSETKIQDAEVVNESQALTKREIALAEPEPNSRPAITAAQAKIEAVAALTATAYARAATLDLTPEESDKLQADFPDEAFKPGAAGKEMLLYIEHPFLRERFTQVFGMGKWAMVPRSRWAEPFKTQKGVDGSRVYVEAMLVIRGCFVAEAIGEMEYYPSNGSQNYGDAVEGAESAAFRRCAKKFGVGLQAWKKDWTEGWWQRKRTAQRPVPRAATPPASAPPPVRAPAPTLSPTVAPAPKAATAAHRAKMIENLKAGVGQPNRPIVTEYFEKIDQLIPGESLESLELRFVPSTAEQMNALADKLAGFGNGEEAARAFVPGEIEAAPASAPAPAAKKPIQVPRENVDKPEDQDAWRQFPMPWGKLAGTPLEDLEKPYLFGLWCNYVVETEYNGRPKKQETIAKDETFRAMLDLCGHHYEFKKPE